MQERNRRILHVIVIGQQTYSKKNRTPEIENCTTKLHLQLLTMCTGIYRTLS